MSDQQHVAASVKQRLLNLARERNLDFNLVLTHYGIERLLYRLSRSESADEFVLKGALLFLLWTDAPHRPTRDLDLLGSGSPEVARIAALFRRICSLKVEADGIDFDPASVRGERIRDDAEYLGVRVRIVGTMGSARIPVRVDVGFGDAVAPPPGEVEYPVLLDQPAPRLRAYRRETVVAEKLHAMVDLGIANSRMKDFYDLRFLADRFSFDGPTLSSAIGATFERRGSKVPGNTPTALTPLFAEDGSKQAQWVGFLRRTRLDDQRLTLAEVIDFLKDFLVPPLEALTASSSFDQVWPPGGPWAVGSDGTG